MQAVMSLAEHVFVLAEGRIIAARRAAGDRRATRASSRPISATARRERMRGAAHG